MGRNKIYETDTQKNSAYRQKKDKAWIEMINKEKHEIEMLNDFVSFSKSVDLQKVFSEVKENSEIEEFSSEIKYSSPNDPITIKVKYEEQRRQFKIIEQVDAIWQGYPCHITPDDCIYFSVFPEKDGSDLLDLFVREVFIFRDKDYKVYNHRDLNKKLIETAQREEVKHSLLKLLSNEQFLATFPLFVKEPLEWLKTYKIDLNENLIKNASRYWYN